jgi:hypothetical protein
MAGQILPFDRDTPCPACGIGLDVVKVCRQPHPGLEPDPARPPTPIEHLHVACPGCGWSACMRVAGPEIPPAAADGERR